MQVYTDGTVLVTHGGVEMGQGLHTKIAQVAASSFNIPLSSVFISETSTDKVRFDTWMYPFALHDLTLDVLAFITSIYKLCHYNEVMWSHMIIPSVRSQMHHQQQPLLVQICMELQFWMLVSKSRFEWNPLLAKEPTTRLQR